MEIGHLSWITNYILGIVDDVIRDLYVRGEHDDVILPMAALRRPKETGEIQLFAERAKARAKVAKSTAEELS